MATVTLDVEREKRIARITLNRPEKLNAINDAMMDDLEAALKEVERDTELWVVVIKGAGRAFCAGQDLSEEGTSRVLTPDPRRRWYLSELWEGERRRLNWWRNIFTFPRFTIAQVHGYCLGWGLYLAMSCRVSIVAEDAILGDPSIRAGFATPCPLWTWKAGVRKAKELLFTGRYITGKEAVEAGLVTQAVPFERLEEAVAEAARVLIAGTPIGGFDQESFNFAFGLGSFDISGLAAAWDYASNIFALSAIQRRGFEPEEYDFFEARERLGLKKAIEERDRPFKELGF